MTQYALPTKAYTERELHDQIRMVPIFFCENFKTNLVYLLLYVCDVIFQFVMPMFVMLKINQVVSTFVML